MRLLLLGLAAFASVWGQSTLPPIYRFPEAIRVYLALTDTQILKISEQNFEFARWSSGRSQRMYMVQAEIAQETAREPLDPAALGIRYAEVEAIRREIVERNKQLIVANVAVLTPAQVTKLKALEEAMKLASTGSEAQGMKLLPDGCSTTGNVIPASRVLPGPVIYDPSTFYNPPGYCFPTVLPGFVFAP